MYVVMYTDMYEYIPTPLPSRDLVKGDKSLENVLGVQNVLFLLWEFLRFNCLGLLCHEVYKPASTYRLIR